MAAIKTISTTRNTAFGAKSTVQLEKEAFACVQQADWLVVCSTLKGIHLQKSSASLTASLFAVSAAFCYVE